MKATLSNYRISPRKIRLVANLVKGKTVARARAELSFLPKRSAPGLVKLINSALANAKQADANLTADNLVISGLVVDKGKILRRFMPRARGSSAPIRHRLSHITVNLRAKATKEKD